MKARILILALLLLLPRVAAAQTVFNVASLPANLTLSWAPPTQDVNNNPVTLTGYSVVVDSAAAVSVPATATSFPFTIATPGTHTLSLTANDSAGPSAAAPLSFTLAIIVVVPKPPTALTLTAK